MYHIKRDQGMLCGFNSKELRYSFLRREGFISFSDAHKSKLDGCCKKCKERYVDILNKMKNPPQPIKGSYYFNLAVISLK